MRRGQRRDQPPGHRGGLRRQRVRQVGPDRQRGPQQVGGQHERQPGLAVMAAGGQHGGTGPGRFGAQLGDEPCLAAAGLAGDGHHPAAMAVPRPPRGRPPARPRAGWPARRSGPPAARSASPRPPPQRPAPPELERPSGRRHRDGRRSEPPRAHVVVEPRSLRQRPDGEVAVEHPHQRPVLPHGGRTLPGPAVQPDDRLVGGFVQRVELQPAAGVPGRPLQRALGDARRDQPLQPPGERLPELLAHRRPATPRTPRSRAG